MFRAEDGTRYEDTGCEFSPACTRCPLPVCKHDDPQRYVIYKQRHLDKLVARMVYQLTAGQGRARTKAIKEVARQQGVTERTIYRQVRRAGE